MNFKFVPMTEPYAQQIASWRYEGIYAFYDSDADPTFKADLFDAVVPHRKEGRREGHAHAGPRIAKIVDNPRRGGRIEDTSRQPSPGASSERKSA